VGKEGEGVSKTKKREARAVPDQGGGQRQETEDGQEKSNLLLGKINTEGETRQKGRGEGLATLGKKRGGSSPAGEKEPRGTKLHGSPNNNQSTLEGAILTRRVTQERIKKAIPGGG